MKGDTAFNESFAVAIEEEGLRRWLKAQAGRPDASQLADEVAHAARLRDQFRAVMLTVRDKLQALYAADSPAAEKRAVKAAIFDDLQSEYRAMREESDPLSVYDNWFARSANNAGIAAIGLYSDRVPEFAALIAADHGDLTRFYRHVKALAQLNEPERNARLASVARTAVASHAHLSGSLMSTE